MFTFIVIIALILCVIIGFAILIQNPKGGGIGGTFGGAANQLFGYSKSSGGIEKFTWYLVAAVFVLCLTSAAFKPTQSTEVDAGLTPNAQQPNFAPPQQDLNTTTTTEEPTGTEQTTEESLPGN